MTYDAVVAGAGTAGCVFAGRLADAGLSVLVVEPSPENQVGHDWWDTVPLTTFDEIGIARPAWPEARTPFSFLMNIEGATLPIRTMMPPELVNIERRMFAARLVAHARDAGAVFMFGTRAVAPLFKSGACTGIRIQAGDSGPEDVNATITLDASGVAGALRRRIPSGLMERGGLEASIPAESMLFTYREVVRDASSGGNSVICMDRSDSIAWLSREPDGLVDVFAGAIGNDLAAAGIARSMLEREGGTGETVRPGRRWSIPLRRPFDGLVLPGFMVAGDSACMADPSNGSGVAHAVRAAILAADTAIKAIRAGDVGMAALWPYPARFFPASAELAFLDALKTFIFSAPREPVLSFMAAGGIRGPAFWTMRREFKPSRLATKCGIFMRTRGGTKLLLPLTAALGAGIRAERLYRSYPGSFQETAFNAWRKRLRDIRGS